MDDRSEGSRYPGWRTLALLLVWLLLLLLAASYVWVLPTVELLRLPR